LDLRRLRSGEDVLRTRTATKPAKTDQGKHLGWYIGKHKGWDKNAKDKPGKPRRD
jgi:hypothetical protein